MHMKVATLIMYFFSPLPSFCILGLPLLTLSLDSPLHCLCDAGSPQKDREEGVETHEAVQQPPLPPFCSNEEANVATKGHNKKALTSKPVNRNVLKAKLTDLTNHLASIPRPKLRLEGAQKRFQTL